ncbi:glycerate kinase [candidate division KSB1 bacterium]|nr:glycerate kinase [candidate division KSB1 bacterium]
MRIIIAPDSFKGSLSAEMVAAAIEAGVRAVNPEIETIKIPMADGGEGTVDALVSSTGGRIIDTKATDPLGGEIMGRYGILGDEKTAVIEMAAVSGLPLVPPRMRNPLNTTTFGTGELIKHALELGCRKFIIGIGGSATNDAGTGMAQALGVIFRKPDGSVINDYMRGGLLKEVASIDMSGLNPLIRESDITVACDVDNPLLGERGCAYVYSPQKGATLEVVKILESSMMTFADILERDTGKNVRNYPGSGAAGGLGAGLMAFLGATLRPGIDLVLKAAQFENQIIGADYVLTGEGKLDEQTVYGKTIAGVTAVAKKHGIPVIAIVGKFIDSQKLIDMGLTSYFSICDGPNRLDYAMKNAAVLIESLSKRLVRLLIAVR